MPKTHFIAGTAGHIDHGKTALVRALTGVDTDRLKEEKERGITIDLGFASSTFPNDITLSWIDVPGHERFIGNMLAGAAGIDLVVLVVAATEGVMPQTREHFDICRMLGVRHGLIALTKADLVDDDGLDLARADVQALVHGSFLADAPVVPVSSRTGDGVSRLRDALLSLLSGMERRPASGSFRLPIDRAFVMKGFGTVVTGTVFDGQVAPDQTVALLPGGKPVRIRGIQVHGESVPQASRGQRAAINLAGVDVADVQRGDTLVASGAFRMTREFDVQLEMLPSAPELPPLHPVHFHLATTATVAKVRFHDRLRVAKPGSRSFARVLTEAPLVALPGDHFILRRFSPLETIGGGIILDNLPPRIRRKQFEGEKLAILASGSAAASLNVFVNETAAGCSIEDLVPRLGLPEAAMRALAERCGPRLAGPQKDWLLSAEQAENLAERLQAVLAAFHKQNPMLPGMPKEQLRIALNAPWPDGIFDWFLGQDARFVRNAEVVRLSVHQPALSGPEAEASRRIESVFLLSKLQVPSVEEALAQSGIDAKLAFTILQSLIRQGRLVKVGNELVFHKQNLVATIGVLQQRRGQRFSVAEFKDWTGVSRKYAIPLLEFLDRQRITRRDGDARIDPLATWSSSCSPVYEVDFNLRFRIFHGRIRSDIHGRRHALLSAGIFTSKVSCCCCSVPQPRLHYPGVRLAIGKRGDLRYGCGLGHRRRHGDGIECSHRPQQNHPNQRNRLLFAARSSHRQLQDHRRTAGLSHAFSSAAWY
ncbi:MAG: selenocysteine-specific translation elongation factor [Bryobacterales bacterium]|nr:selenocysteine-specific translation elongation factor [Bryobacterales bacterium]